MRTADTFAGVLVLALVAGGVYWARGRSAGPDEPALRESRDLGGPGAPDRQSPKPEGTGIPDVTVADATVELDDLRVTLSMAPRPPVAFATTRFGVRVERGGAPVALEGGRIAFEMTMPMGDHRYTLVPGGEGWQRAEVVLPFCKSGNPRWFATVEGTVDGRRVTARFRLDLTRP
jgi:hypothetical protein